MSFLIKELSILKNLVLVLCFIVNLVLMSCAHPISEEFRKSIDPNTSLPKISKNPNQYANQNVMFGGVIIAVRNFPDKTEIEVIQKDLDYFGYPSRGDVTEGRFIFVKQGFLEPKIYSEGRYVTGAGKLTGTQVGKIDNLEVELPVIEVVELRLWEDFSKKPYNNFAYPYYYGPFAGPFFSYGRGFNQLWYPYWW